MAQGLELMHLFIRVYLVLELFTSHYFVIVQTKINLNQGNDWVLLEN
jgi:hypothetical protein